MISISSYVREGQLKLRRLALEPAAHRALRAAGWWAAGFVLSAAAMLGRSLPLAMALVCGTGGWPAVLGALGGAVGYVAFWGLGEAQMLLCLLAGLLAVLTLGRQELCRGAPLLMPGTAALIVAVSGVIFHSAAQDLQEFTVHLTRVALAFGVTWLTGAERIRPDPVKKWLLCAFGVFSLAQIVPLPYVGLGYAALAYLVSAAAFPAAVLGALALDLARITPVPMTAVAALAYLVRLLPRYDPWMGRLAAPVACVTVMGLAGKPDWMPLPGLLAGGLLSAALPPPAAGRLARGKTGAAQVRLEVAAGVLEQTRRLLLEVPPVPVDRDALLQKAVAEACGGCPYRKACKDQERVGAISGGALDRTLLYTQDLPVVCRKSSRMLSALHRAQDQLRIILADRQRQKEYREAVLQQYSFLASFLQTQADRLTDREKARSPVYSPRITQFSQGREEENGDQCMRFAGLQGKYYVLLCDGMGTGLGAEQESRTAAVLLRRLLCAGFPAEHALGSLNSLCALRERAGAVTVDLAEICLDTGKTVVYKWGAAPSYLVSRGGAERIGEVCVPPGIGVRGSRESAHAVTLRRGQILALVSDGVDSAQALRCCTQMVGATAEELGKNLMDALHLCHGDDATVVLVELVLQA